jgi:hypothetical protein
MNNYNHIRQYHQHILFYPIKPFVIFISRTRNTILAVTSFFLFFIYTLFLFAVLSLYHCGYAVQDNYHHFSFRNKFTDTHTIYSIPVCDNDKIIVVNPDNSIQLGRPSSSQLKKYYK